MREIVEEESFQPPMAALKGMLVVVWEQEGSHRLSMTMWRRAAVLVQLKLNLCKSFKTVWYSYESTHLSTKYMITSLKLALSISAFMLGTMMIYSPSRGQGLFIDGTNTSIPDIPARLTCGARYLS